jgi:hypothetical protein
MMMISKNENFPETQLRMYYYGQPGRLVSADHNAVSLLFVI